jgi:photosystem II stability/assembly factor-like uncharacterized protein
LTLWQNFIIHTGIALASLLSPLFPVAQTQQTWVPIGPLGQFSIGDIESDATDPNKLYAVAGRYFYTSSDFGISWDSYLVGNETETLLSIVNDPTDSRIFYSPSNYFTYKSHDSGLSWYPIGFRYWQLETDPFTPGKLYAIKDGSLYLSTDFGENWVLSNYPTTFIVSTVTFDPTNQSVIYLSGSNGIEKSTDGGNNWTSISGNLTNQSFTELIVSPQDSEVIYAVSSNYGVFLTRDGGVEWTRVIYPNAYDGGFAMDPTDAATIYYTQAYNGVYQSKNWGQTWTNINGNMTAIYPRVILALGNSDKTVLIALETNGIFGKNGNETIWKPCGLSRANVGAFAVDPTNSETMYLARDKSGLYKTVDGGKNWFLINDGLPDFTVTSLTIDPHNPDLIFLGLYDKGLFRSTDQGASWIKFDTDFNLNGTISSLVIDPRNPERIFGIYKETYVFRSLDGGESWSFVGDNLFGKNSLKLDPFDLETIYVTNRILQKSTDNGDTWETISDGIPATNLVAVFPSPAQRGVLYVTTEYGVLYKTVDGGQNWSQISGENHKYNLTFDPRIPSIIYASGGVNGIGSMFFSTDGGRSWNFYGSPGDSSYMIENTYINTGQEELLAEIAFDDYGIYKTSLLPVSDTFLPIIFGSD